MSFNQSLFLIIHGWSGRYAILDGLGIFLAEYMPYLLVLGFLIFAYYQGGRKGGWRRKLYVFCEGALAVILARGIVTEFIRLFYHHARPFSFYNFTPLISEAGWSFPSGHAAWFFALAMTIWYFNRKWGIWYFVLATIMGIARIYVGVHWPLDIVGGAIVGVASAIFVHWLLRTQRAQLSG